MKRILNRMLRYADAIVKRGVDKLIDVIGQSAEPQTKNAETPQLQKSMGNGTDCGITLMDEQCDISYNTRVRDNIQKSKEQKNIQPTKGGHKMVTCQNYVSLFYCQITSCPSDGGIS